jgi:Kef-type K+ transport system membrane component KefB
MLKETPWYAIFIIIFLSFGAKILSTLLVFLLHNKPMEDGFALGVIMNTKGVMSIIIINAGRNIKVGTMHVLQKSYFLYSIGDQEFLNYRN